MTLQGHGHSWRIVTTVRSLDKEIAIQKDGTTELSLDRQRLPSEARDQLIAKLYTGTYSQEIETLRFGRVISGLWARAFGSAPPIAHLTETHESQSKTLF